MVSEAFEESIVIIQILNLLKPACTQLRGSVRCDVLDEEDVVNEISLLLIGYGKDLITCHSPNVLSHAISVYLQRNRGVGWGGGGGVGFGHISHLRLAD